MRAMLRVRSSAPLVFLFFLAGAVSAQEGVLSGSVTDAETSAPVAGATVQLLGFGGSSVTGMISDQSGQFRFTVPTGTYAVVVQMVGFLDARVDGVRLSEGETEFVAVSLTPTAFFLDPITVTATRTEEKALEAPASVSVVGAELIAERIAPSPVEHVKALPGVDIAQTGLAQSNVVTRGFNNIFSGALLVITDNRYARVPSLNFNAYNMIPATDLDVERIEVLLGPGAALYGPNSASGVMHMITTSPIDAPGTKVSFAGGLRSENALPAGNGLPALGDDERSVFQVMFRHATRLSDEFGFKVSGQYFRGNDWLYIDPFEETARQDAIDAGADPDTLKIGLRDYFAERVGGEARIDWRPSDDTELILSGGYNRLMSSVELTGIGAGQAQGWGYSFGQARFRKGRLFIQAFGNFSSAGDTYLLRTGDPIVDRSRMLVGQVQHGFGIGDRQDFVYGVDLQRTIPETDGTITGRYEDDDTFNEVGGYLHSKTALSQYVDLVAALRVDHHSELEDLVFSPRAALVVKPAENQNFRVTFNRAFSTPTTNNLFLDRVAGRIPLGPGIGYDIRALGTPKEGLTFDDECTGGEGNRCMYSPFVPGQQLPATAAIGPIWNGLLDAAALQDPSLAPLLPFLKVGPGQNPDIQSSLMRFDSEKLTYIPSGGPVAIERLQPTITNTYEAGYKGLLGQRVLLAADVYYSEIKDFVGPLKVETPNVFMEPISTGAFIVQRLTPLVQAGQLTPAQAAAIAGQITNNFARIPLGTIGPDQNQNTDIIVAYRNFGDIDLWGADFAAQALLTNEFSVTASYSVVSEECFDFDDDDKCSSPEDIALNAPKKKGAVSARYSSAIWGFSAEGRLRFTDGFSMNSGVYVGEIDKYTVFDLNLSYKTRFLQGATLSISVSNLFDKKHQEFIGAPEMGRLILGRVLYEF